MLFINGRATLGQLYIYVVIVNNYITPIVVSISLNVIDFMIIAVDFDGTIVEHRYPTIGEERPFATETLKKLIVEGHRIILWTVREGRLLDEAIRFCEERGVKFYAINRNYPEENFADGSCARKLNADVWIDDRNVGGLPDWGTIYEMITGRLMCEDVGQRQELAKNLLLQVGFWKRFFRK